MILNEEFLRENISSSEVRSLLNESQYSLKHFAEENFDIFISHSSFDSELVCSLYKLFKEKGFNVYIDYDDKELNPNIVSPKTGLTLRNRMKNSRCLAYIATDNTTASKWCPWEMGFYDGISNGKCCILPILKGKLSYFKGQEYLGMYPYLSYEKAENSDKWYFWVNDPKNRKEYTELSKWIDGGELITHE